MALTGSTVFVTRVSIRRHSLPSESSTGISDRRCRRSFRSVSGLTSPSRRKRKLRNIASATGASRVTPCSKARRTSPSVSVPAIRPSLSVTMSVITAPERSLSRLIAVMRGASSVMICLSICIFHDFFGYKPVERSIKVDRSATWHFVWNPVRELAEGHPAD